MTFSADKFPFEPLWINLDGARNPQRSSSVIFGIQVMDLKHFLLLVSFLEINVI
jgi:hypothetical protein